MEIGQSENKRKRERESGKAARERETEDRQGHGIKRRSICNLDTVVDLGGILV